MEGKKPIVKIILGYLPGLILATVATVAGLTIYNKFLKNRIEGEAEIPAPVAPKRVKSAEGDDAE